MLSYKEQNNKLSISNLLNEVSIDPMQHPLAPNPTKIDLSSWNTDNRKTSIDYFNNINYSPISSGSSTPSDSNSSSRQSSIHMEPPDLWSHSRTGMHQTTSGDIIVSSLSKARRKRILPYQYEKLMETFETTDTPSSEIRGQLAKELYMTKREVQVWFQNRRAKMSRTKSNRRQSSLKSIEDIPIRRASEYLPYGNVKSIAPRRSTTSAINYSPKMVLESPYHPTTTNYLSPPSTENSAIDLLASAAEMVRQN